MSNSETIKLHRISDNDGKYGFADEAGNIVIPCKWKDVEEFSEGLAAVENEKGKWGFIDLSGAEIIPCEWFLAISFQDGRARVINDSIEYGLIDKKGNMIIPCTWKRIEEFNDGLACVLGKNKKYGFIDKTGKVVIPCIWEDASSFHNDQAFVKDEDGNIIVIDKEGTILSTDEKKNNWQYTGKYNEGLAAVMDHNSQWGFINETGALAIPCIWKEAWSFKEGLAMVRDNNSLFGFIDKTGTLVIPSKWTNADNFNNGLARVMDESHIWYSIDKKGNVVKMLSDEWTAPLHPYIKNGKTGLINKNGEEVIPCEWRMVKYSSGYNFIKVMGDNYKWGGIDMTGNQIIPCEWREIEYFHEGLAAVQDEYGMWGFVDETGKNIIPCRWVKGKYGSYGLYEFHSGLSMVMDEDFNYGFINKKGVLVIPCNYRYAEPFKNGHAKVTHVNGDEVVINKSGKVVEVIKSYEKEREKARIAKEKRDAKKETVIEEKKAMLRDFYKQYGVKAQFIYLSNYVRTTNLFVVPALKGQVVSFYAHKDFKRDYYERAMQLVEYLNKLTTSYGKSKVQKKGSLPKEANDALQAKVKELELEDLWKGIFNESQRHYLDGKYKVVASI